MSTPILYRGDRILLQMPLSGVEPENYQKNRIATEEAYKKAFADEGVHVMGCITSDNFNDVKVVAIFRRQEP